MLLIVALLLHQSFALNNCPASPYNSTDDCSSILSTQGCPYFYEFDPDARTAWTGIPWLCAYPPSEAPDQTYCVTSETACIPPCYFNSMKGPVITASNCGGASFAELCAVLAIDTGSGYKWCMWDESGSDCIGLIPCHI
jgi:hypothetical protein